MRSVLITGGTGFLGRGEKMHERMLEDGPTSEEVRRMTIDELREALQHV